MIHSMRANTTDSFLKEIELALLCIIQLPVLALNEVPESRGHCVSTREQADHELLCKHP